MAASKIRYTANGETATYTYRLDGLRYSKTTNAKGLTYFGWQGNNIVTEYNKSGAVTNNYTRGLNLIKNSNSEYYVFDAHNDVIQLTNSGGTVTKDYTYDAFGNEANILSSDTNPFRYCGQYFDNETGLIYLRARYYNPATGSFITEDPAFDGVNWYSYCGGNPVNFSDLTGLVTDEDRANLNATQIAELEQCERDYNSAKEKNDYVGMNRAHDTANSIRYTYNKNIYENDSYDYTHGNNLIVAGSFTANESVIIKYVYLVKDEDTARAQSINEGDFVCVDDRNNEKDPNIKVIDSYAATDDEIEKVVDVLLNYEKNHPTAWNRSRGSLIKEWKWHNFIYSYSFVTEQIDKTADWSQRTRDVDLNNADEETFPEHMIIPKVWKYL